MYSLCTDCEHSQQPPYLTRTSSRCSKGTADATLICHSFTAFEYFDASFCACIETAWSNITFSNNFHTSRSSASWELDAGLSLHPDSVGLRHQHQQTRGSSVIYVQDVLYRAALPVRADWSSKYEVCGAAVEPTGGPPEKGGRPTLFVSVEVQVPPPLPLVVT